MNLKKFLICIGIVLITLFLFNIIIKIMNNSINHDINYNNYEDIVQKDYDLLSDLIVSEDNEERLYMSDIVKRFKEIENSNGKYKDAILFNPPIDANLNECYGYFIINTIDGDINIDAKNMCKLTNR